MTTIEGLSLLCYQIRSLVISGTAEQSARDRMDICIEIISSLMSSSMVQQNHLKSENDVRSVGFILEPQN